MLSIPFLPSLVRAKDVAENIPARFISLRTVNGQPPQLFYPGRPNTKLAEHIYYQSFQQGQTISPIINSNFSSIAHKLSVIRGVDFSNNGHNSELMLADGLIKVDGKVISGDKWVNSLDEVMARSSVIYPNTPQHRILRLEPSLSVKYGPKKSYSYWDGIRQPYDRLMPDLFKKLFPKSNLSEGEVDIQKQKKLKAVDLAKDAYDTLKNSRKISSTDKMRMQQYYDELNDLENKINTVTSKTCSIPDTHAPAGNTFAAYDLGIDIIMLALSCDMTRVVSLSAPHFGALPGENGSSFHGISHWYYKSTALPDEGFGVEKLMVPAGSAEEDKYKRMHSWTGDLAAKLMTRMDSIVESNGKTMLDNSLVYWGNEQAGSSGHSNYSPPIVVGGTLNGRVKPGYWDFTRRPFIHYAGRTDLHLPAGTVPQTNFLTTLANLYGLDPSSYERNGVKGFGYFDLSLRSSYTFKRGNLRLTNSEVYAPYTSTAANRGKNIPGWVA
jgi:hypothetical protein